MTTRQNTTQTAGSGLVATGAAVTPFAPYVGAALAGAGALTSLYGGYQQQQSEQANYRDQMREYNRQMAIDDEARRRKMEEEAIAQRVGVSNFYDEGEKNRMAQYAKYYSQIGR